MTSIPRRSFVVITGAALVAPNSLLGNQRQQSDVPPLVDQVPPMLDHILLGCNDLQRGISFVEQHTGVRAAFGGVRSSSELNAELKKLSEPRLVGWAAHPGDVQVLAADLARAGVAAEGPTPGSRKRPEGSVLHWKTLKLKDDANGLLPFFIEWSADSPHPSADAPSGCQLLRFELLTPDPVALDKRTAQLKLKAPLVKAASSQLHAVISGPKGKLDATS